MSSRCAAAGVPPLGASTVRFGMAARTRGVLDWEVDADPRVYVSEISCQLGLTEQEEQRLAWNVINEGCEASLERLVRSNLVLVVGISRRYVGRGLSLASLINSGNRGLLNAALGFDPERDGRFSTYANWRIKHVIRQDLAALTSPARVRVTHAR